ncbi:alpha/beta fold hydrolase [Actinomadura gamaensis]|uniref:Alpha/beta fold hydrolase n=1 Tax=Actinomadura gamaensis TaxID=1763541 RepID=A0ABV9U8Z3_9ACTN
MHKVISADGTPIAYEASGEGPVVIVVGGAFNDRMTALPLADALDGTLTVVRYDRRGRGDSGDNAAAGDGGGTITGDDRANAAAREVEDLRALVDAVGGTPALYGMSSGGALALRAAADGVPVSRIALYEVPFVPDDRSAQARETAEAVSALLAEGRRADAVVAFMSGIGMPPEMAEGMRHAPMFPALEAIAHTLDHDAAAMGAFTAGSVIPEDVARAVRVPTLAIFGEASPPWTAETARRLAALVPDGRVASLPGQSHDVAPEALAPVLAEFVRAR